MIIEAAAAIQKYSHVLALSSQLAGAWSKQRYPPPVSTFPVFPFHPIAASFSGREPSRARVVLHSSAGCTAAFPPESSPPSPPSPTDTDVPFSRVPFTYHASQISAAIAVVCRNDNVPPTPHWRPHRDLEPSGQSREAQRGPVGSTSCRER